MRFGKSIMALVAGRGFRRNLGTGKSLSFVRPQNMPPEVIAAILSSSAVSAVVAAAVAGWFNLRSKRSEYENAYFKMVLERRIQAYEQVEALITKIKIAVLDDDRQPYHLLFSDNETKDTTYTALLSVMASALWLSDDLFDETRKLNVLIYSGSEGSGAENLISFGKKNYREVAELRTRVEKLHARDMLTLHEVPKFLRSKKPTDSYGEIKTEA
jgi:hypothetical protein